MGGKKKYIEMFGSFTEPFSCNQDYITSWLGYGSISSAACFPPLLTYCGWKD